MKNSQVNNCHPRRYRIYASKLWRYILLVHEEEECDERSDSLCLQIGGWFECCHFTILIACFSLFFYQLKAEKHKNTTERKESLSCLIATLKRDYISQTNDTWIPTWNFLLDFKSSTLFWMMVDRSIPPSCKTLSRKSCQEVLALDKVFFTRTTNSNTEGQSHTDLPPFFVPGTDDLAASFIRNGIPGFTSNDELGSVVYSHGDDSHLLSTYVFVFFSKTTRQTLFSLLERCSLHERK